MSLLPQFGFVELVLVAALALMVVGPKDLPKLFRSLGKMAAQARKMANEFTSAFDQMAREAELDDMRKEIEALKQANPVNDVVKAAKEVVEPIKKTAEEAVAAAERKTDPSVADPQSDQGEPDPDHQSSDGGSDDAERKVS
ncbi:MAG: Sec-independent protein translocase protein TatB [Pseudomonadota bacterium]